MRNRERPHTPRRQSEWNETVQHIVPLYLLFLAKTVTVVIAVATVVVVLARQRHRRREEDHIEVKRLNDRYQRMEQALKTEILPKRLFKQELKRLKHEEKDARKAAESDRDARKRIFVLQFHGDIKASALESLREEITAILMVATPNDELFLRLESGGGMVHTYGLAASQLQRVKSKGIPLTISVDKVAASGGYMMACIADRIIAAPFAIIGSIGVIAQLPNFNRLLKKNNIDFEQITAGEFKRTLTVFGENTDAGRDKLKQEIEDTHTLFKALIADYRKDADIQQVATGEHWYGSRALELKLVDELATSDDYLLRASREADLYEVSYVRRRRLGGRLASLMPAALQKWG